MVAKFVNFDDEPLELQARGKLLNGNGKATLDEEPIAKFEGGTLEPISDQPNKSETITRVTIAPLGTPPPAMYSTVWVISYHRRAIVVDVFMVVAVFVWLQDISSKD